MMKDSLLDFVIGGTDDEADDGTDDGDDGGDMMRNFMLALWLVRLMAVTIVVIWWSGGLCDGLCD